MFQYLNLGWQRSNLGAAAWFLPKRWTTAAGNR